MNDLIKSHWASDGDNTIRLSMPIAKVDRQNRLVSGWATLDNVDSQGDIVTAEASRKAFARARGNIREMHQNIAVGTIVDFREDEFAHEDPETGVMKFYRGIFVTARVSEGAPDTWIKVLDGTLSGFSIGGSIIDASNEMSKDGSGPVRIVKDYDLVELSLVDNPANQLANVFSIQKTATGSVIKGMVADTVVENVFFCKEDKTVKSVNDSVADCPKCGLKMDNIGWFESGSDRAEKVKEIVAKFNTPENEGGEEMKLKDAIEKSASEGNEENVEAVESQENETSEEVVEAAEPVEETPTAVDAVTGETSDGEEAEEVTEVTDDEEVISKRIDELKTVINDTLEKNRQHTTEAVEALEGRITEMSESFEKKASELEQKFQEFGQILDVEKGRLSNLEKKLDKMNTTHAVKKSSDLDNESGEEIVQKSKSLWDGAFSVNNLR